MNTKNVKLTGPCEKEHLSIGGKLATKFSVIFCSSNLTSITLSPVGIGIKIEYYSDQYYNQTELDISIMLKTPGK